MWPLVLFMLFSLLVAPLIFGVYIAYVYRWFNHRRMLNNPQRHFTEKNVCIVWDICPDDLSLQFAGKVDAFEVYRDLDDFYYGSPAFRVYAAFQAFDSSKHEHVLGDLTYYMHKGNRYYVSFHPYSSKDCRMHYPQLRRSQGEKNFILIGWFLLLNLIAFAFVFLFVVLPQM